MNQLMSTNVNTFEATIIICGTCLPEVDKTAFKKIQNISNNVFFVCLEETHMNTVGHKISAILQEGKVKKAIFVSVDKSPHCVQLHYLQRELKKIMNHKNIDLLSYVAKCGELIEIPIETIALSKSLAEINQLRNSLTTAQKR